MIELFPRMARSSEYQPSECVQFALKLTAFGELGASRGVEEAYAAGWRRECLCIRSSHELGSGGFSCARLYPAQQGVTLPLESSVTRTGAARFTVPVSISPGTAGMAPNLTLAYDSQAGNGLLGMCWQLEDLPAIQRCPRTVATDGVHGGVNFDANDRFCLDDQRLIAIGLAISETSSLNQLVLSAISNAYGSVSLGGTRRRTFLSGSVANRKDLDGTAFPSVTTTYQYDAYGNAIEVTASTSAGFSKTTTNSYSNDEINWLLGRLTRATVDSQAP